MQRALILAGGDKPDRAILDDLGPFALVVGADSGASHAVELDLPVDIAVGDFDSLAANQRKALERNGVDLRRHSPDKDATDLELALQVTQAEGAENVVVAAVDGDELDHVFGNLIVLANPAWSQMSVTALVGRALVTVVRCSVVLTGRVGELVSLFAVNGPASGVTLQGLAYELSNAELAPASSRAMRNTFIKPTATVAVNHGVLIAIQPDRYLPGAKD